MVKITFQSAQQLFHSRNYAEAYQQFCRLVEQRLQPAFCSFMAGKCMSLGDNDTEAFALYEQALSFDDSNAFINREVERFHLAHSRIDPSKKILWHFFPNTTNIGDSGSAAGIRALFRSVSDTFSFYSLSCRNDSLKSLQSSAPRAHGIIIGGGGLFFRQPTASGWYFPLTATELTALDIPAVTYATGLNQEFSSEAAWQLDKNFLNILVRYHNAFTLKSVRDVWSRKMLTEAGVSDLHLVPCPSAFLPPLAWYNLTIDKTIPVIGISITDRSLAPSQRLKLLDSFFNFARWLTKNKSLPLFIMHDSADDMHLAKQVSENGFNCIIANTAREAVSLYERCSIVIGMRGHSLILAAGQCVPVLAISYNKKVDAFMELLEMQNYSLNQNLITDDMTLIRAFENILANSDMIRKHLTMKRDQFYTLNQTYCNAIINVITREQLPLS